MVVILFVVEFKPQEMKLLKLTLEYIFTQSLIFRVQTGSSSHAVSKQL